MAVDIFRGGQSDFPILTELTIEIASCSCDRQGFGAREDMEERFFLDRL